MKLYPKALLIAILLNATPGQLAAQGLMQFMHHPLTARGWAIGGATTAWIEDGAGLLANPAILPRLESSWQVNYSSFMLDIYSTSIYSNFQLGNKGDLAAAVQYLDYGSFTERDADGNAFGNFSVHDLQGHLVYAYPLTPKTSLGASLSFFQSELQAYGAEGLFMSFGALYYHPGSTLAVGISAQNLGLYFDSYASADEMPPTTLRIGIAKHLEYLPLTISLDTYQAYHRKYVVRLGGEFHIGDHLFLRFGSSSKRFHIRGQRTFRNFLAGSSTGIGFTVRRFQADLALVGLGDAGTISSFSLSQHF